MPGGKQSSVETHRYDRVHVFGFEKFSSAPIMHGTAVPYLTNSSTLFNKQLYSYTFSVFVFPSSDDHVQDWQR